MKVTDVPSQTLLFDAETETEGVTWGIKLTLSIPQSLSDPAEIKVNFKFEELVTGDQGMLKAIPDFQVDMFQDPQETQVAEL